MLAVLLKVLSVLGIILLVLLGLLLIILLLILFFPITYRVYGRRDTESMIARIKINWLFGLVRVRFFYPEPGRVVVKLLGFSLSGKAKQSVPKSKEDVKASKTPKSPMTEPAADEQTATPGSSATPEPDSFVEQDTFTGEAPSLLERLKQRFFEKYEKIKYTITKIYDKIKDILENLSFYKELLLEDDTKQLLGHAKFRVGKLLKKLRPRRLKADIIFGTGSPDTTGYVLGIYGMLSPQIKKPCYVNLTPDFTQAVLQGELKATGHITVFCVLSNGILLLLDKRLRMLINKIKKHNAMQSAA